MGKVPLVSIDKTDGCQVYLGKESVEAEIVTAKSSELNVMIPQGEDFVRLIWHLSLFVLVSLCLSIYLSVSACLSIHPFVSCLPVCVCVYPSMHLSVCVFYCPPFHCLFHPQLACLWFSMSTCLSACQSVSSRVCTSTCFL